MAIIDEPRYMRFIFFECLKYRKTLSLNALGNKEPLKLDLLYNIGHLKDNR